MMINIIVHKYYNTEWFLASVILEWLVRMKNIKIQNRMEYKTVKSVK